MTFHVPGFPQEIKKHWRPIGHINFNFDKLMQFQLGDKVTHFKVVLLMLQMVFSSAWLYIPDLWGIHTISLPPEYLLIISGQTKRSKREVVVFIS